MTWLPGIEPGELATLFIVTVVAAVVQRATGTNFGTITSAFIALFAPEYVPSAVMLLGFPLIMAATMAERRAIRLGEIGWALAGRIALTWPAAMLVAALAGTEWLGLAVAFVLLGGAALSAYRPVIQRTPLTLVFAGAASGFFATLVAVGAAPMGLLSANEEARAARP
ncbi:MAG: hypothetical protein AAF401_01875, partial [Pseudomonadota bacterium]